MLETLARFPCALDKTPLTPHGFKDARRNLDCSGAPLVGIASGAINGIDCLDIDSPDGVGWYDLNFDALPPTRAHSTKRGLHLIWKHAAGVGCWNGQIAKGVDVKGDGGYFIWWPREG